MLKRTTVHISHNHLKLINLNRRKFPTGIVDRLQIAEFPVSVIWFSAFVFSLDPFSLELPPLTFNLPSFHYSRLLTYSFEIDKTDFTVFTFDRGPNS